MSKDDGLLYVGDSAGDEFLDVTFYQKTENGEDIDFINIKVPGDKTLEIDERVTDSYKFRFARKYEAFKAMQNLSGTPIDEWTDIPEGMRRDFAYQGFRFVEQVAGAPDSAFSRINGGHQWRYKAQNFLQRGKINSDDLIKKQSEQIESLQRQMQELMGAVNKSKPGRKPKEQVHFDDVIVVEDVPLSIVEDAD